MKYATSLLVLAVAAVYASAPDAKEAELKGNISVTLEGTNHHGNEFPALKIHINRIPRK